MATKEERAKRLQRIMYAGPETKAKVNIYEPPRSVTVINEDVPVQQRPFWEL